MLDALTLAFQRSQCLLAPDRDSQTCGRMHSIFKATGCQLALCSTEIFTQRRATALTEI